MAPSALTPYSLHGGPVSCPHLAKAKRDQSAPFQNLQESYRTCVRYSLSWRSRAHLAVPKQNTKVAKLYAEIDEEVERADMRKNGSTDQEIEGTDLTKKRKRTIQSLEREVSFLEKPNTKKQRLNNWVPKSGEVDLLKHASKALDCGDLHPQSAPPESLPERPSYKVHLQEGRQSVHGMWARRPISESKKLLIQVSFYVEAHSPHEQFYYPQPPDQKNQPLTPVEFLHLSWAVRTELSGYQQQDSHEFFIACLNEMHGICSGRGDHDTSGCKCIVHTAFSGVLHSDILCSNPNCQFNNVKEESVLDISLDVHSEPTAAKKPTKKKATSTAASAADSEAANGVKAETNGAEAELNKKGKVVGNEGKMDGVSLLECLEKYTSPDIVDGYKCEQCGHAQNNTKQLTMKQLPPILGFNLKHYDPLQPNKKTKAIVRLPAELDMTPFTTRSVKHRHKMGEKKRRDSGGGPTVMKRMPSRGTESIWDATPSHKYKLFAVVNHRGTAETGHYVAYAKHRGQWFAFDDALVQPATEREVLDSNSYMCFYMRENYQHNVREAFEIKGFHASNGLGHEDVDMDGDVEMVPSSPPDRLV
ncbi:hypothetical protein HK097_011008 [Rhizophlyctis rosea]|uniref:USP domain-containing protein n=1 Tax=Rhizophlyctis rosea TaxID=64517 RepID=A0AAD5X8N9_9FUNG|nr:hypothetical protein HK097_011008 [Rhizophlyctis rosea]